MAQNEQEMTFKYDKRTDNAAEIQRFVNTHLSRVAKSKRAAKNEKLTREQAQRQRRQQEAEQQPQNDNSCSIGSRSLNSQHLDSLLLVNHDIFPFIIPGSANQEQNLQACHDFLAVFVPHEAHTLGLTTQQGIDLGSALLLWMSEDELVQVALATYRLCCTPDSQDLSHPIRMDIEHLRSQMIAKINQKLAAQQVDDILIFGIMLAIIVDTFLDHTAFIKVHAQGLEAVVKIRGGVDAVGSSHSQIAGALQRLVSTTLTTAQFHINTTISDETAETSAILAVDPLDEHRLSGIGQGFAELASLRLITSNMVVIIERFAHWLGSERPDERLQVMPWSQPVPEGLNNLEKCILVALTCLICDVQGSSYQHMSAMLRRKPGARARALLDLRSLWQDPRLVQCAFWLAAVVTSPTQVGIVPRKEILLLQDRLYATRPEMRDKNVAQRALKRFILPPEQLTTILGIWSGDLRAVGTDAEF